MTNYNNKCFYISDIFENNGEFKYLARIENYSKRCKLIAVGENIATDEFTLVFPNSIGTSQWKLLLYPNGQYLNGKAGSHVGIYLNLLSCDIENETLTADVMFQVKASPENEADGHVIRKKKNEFVFSDPSKRWFGQPKFEQIHVIHSPRYKRFFVDDTLTICCSVKEWTARSDSEDFAPSASESIDVGLNSQSELFLRAANAFDNVDGKAYPKLSKCDSDDLESTTWKLAGRNRKNGKQNETRSSSSILESNSNNQRNQSRKAEENAVPNVKENRQRQPKRKCKTTRQRHGKKK